MKIKTILKRVVRAMPRSTQLQLREIYLAKQVASGKIPAEADLILLDHLVEPGNAVADIGANIGVFTKKLADLVGPHGSVMSFEPVATNFAILRSMIRQAGLRNVQAFQAALGATEQERVEIIIPEGDTFEGLYEAHLSFEGTQNEIGVREIVEVRTLDAMRENQPPLDFIKCDVEGHELPVLKGASRVLETCKPGWLMEVSRGTSQIVFEIFYKLGYMSFVEQNQKLTRVNAYQDGWRSNYFFLHPDSKIWRRAQTICT